MKQKLILQNLLKRFDDIIHNHKPNNKLEMQKNTLIITIALALPVFGFGQANEAIQKLNDAGVTIEQIEHSLKDADAEFYFKSTNTTVSKSEDGNPYTSVTICEFDPSKSCEEHWKLISTDGITPTESENKTFNRTTNSNDEFNGKIDLESVKILSEDDSRLVIGLRYSEKSLPRKFRFYADCDVTYTIDKVNKQLVSGTIVNFKETKMSIAKLSNVKVDLEFIFLNEAEGYHIKNEQIEMTILVLGQQSESNSTIVYSDFNKVK